MSFSLAELSVVVLTVFVVNEVEDAGSFDDAVCDSAAVIVDCARCVFREKKCSDCVVSVVVDTARPLHWTAEELRAVNLLADAGMVPPLHHVAA